MAEIKSLQDLEKEVNKRINRCLRDDIAPLIKHEIQKSVDENVYEVYDPIIYERRKEEGGLMDVQNMTAIYEDCGVDVYNDASAVGKNFDPLDEKIEYGYGYMDKAYNVGRPFMDKAQDNVNSRADEIVRLLSKAINK